MLPVTRRAPLAALIAGLALAAAMTSAAGAASDEAVPVDIPDAAPTQIGDDLTPEQLTDLATLAQERGITLEESIERSGWHESFAMLADRFRGLYPDSYAGARIETSENPWIAFKADVPSTARSTAQQFNNQVFSANADSPFKGSSYQVDLLPDRGYSEEELDQRLVSAHFSVLKHDDVVANASSGYDIATGEITIVVEPRDAAESWDAEALTSYLKAEGVTLDSVRVQVTQRVRLGNDANIYGGDAMSTCTSGFTVKKSSTRGISTAAHCSNNQSMGGSSLTFKGEHDGTWGDVQWHTGSGYEYDDFYSGSSSTYLTAKRDVGSVGNAVEGQDLCRNGKTTYKECDTVYQLNHCSWDCRDILA